MTLSLQSILKELDRLQLDYLNEEDDHEQIRIVSRFSALLQKATELDGIDRIAAGITIHNWTLDSENH